MHGKNEEAVERSGTEAEAGLFVDGAFVGAKSTGMRGAFVGGTTITKAEFQALLKNSIKNFTQKHGSNPTPSQIAKLAAHLKAKLMSKGVTAIKG